RFPSGIHGFLSGDDWGHQKGLFVKPQVWDEFFKPRYKRIFDAVHKAGWHVWLHSCGKINEAVERLIGLGLDVLNAQQPRLMGIEEIGRMARGRVCFLSECDIQMTLPFATPDEIREEARLILEHWATPDGGFIFKDYTGGEAALAAPRENTEAMLNAFLAFAPWGRKSRNEGEA
ncbi:MAG: hypothetical protein IT330_06610, partial [Anaerolineae bacterium]|nr:hypothetical protein [Anaerolineae bacterium]